MTDKPEYLSQEYWFQIKKRLNEVLGEEKAEVIWELVWATRFEHERQHR